MKLTKHILTLSAISLLTACANSPIRPLDISWCDNEPQEEVINLAADALFYFDRYQTKDLLPKGKQTLDELATKLTNGYAKVDQIDLIGHTDRMGNVSYNYNLGLNRAKTVRAYLQSHGVTAPMSVASAGETQPVTNGCYNLKAPQETQDGRSMSTVSEQLRSCLQPDRRVVVKILGVQKGR